VKEHWDDAYTALFAFQVHPLHPDLPCSIVHTMPATDGKGTPEVVERLLALEDSLTHRFGLSVVALAFDGDAAFNDLHEVFRERWRPRIVRECPLIPLNADLSVIICDPLHLMKRVGSRWVSGGFSIGFGRDEQSSRSTETIQGWNVLSPVVFLNSRISKMHDSLPLRLFSPSVFSRILAGPSSSEQVLTPWCMLTAALTLPGYSTATRIDFLEIGFWYLFEYDQRLTKFGYLTDVVEKMQAGRSHSLYTRQQMRDALNTFAALTIILRSTGDPVCLNRLGSGPLEHAVGRGRILCHDVPTMKRLTASFATESWSLVVKTFLKLTAEPRRHASVGVDCPPFSAPTLLFSEPVPGSLPCYCEPGQVSTLGPCRRKPEQCSSMLGPNWAESGSVTDLAWRKSPMDELAQNGSLERRRSHRTKSFSMSSHPPGLFT
jgi:hypothetical protein